MNSFHPHQANLRDRFGQWTGGSHSFTFAPSLYTSHEARVDYYFMNRMTGSTQTVIIEYGFIDNKQDHAYYAKKESLVTAAEAVIKVICEKIGMDYQKPKKERTNQSVSPKNKSQSYKGKRVESIHAGELRFYTKPSWKDADVFGYLTKGIGFNEILEKVKVGSGEQYKVRSTKGDIFYVTASPSFVQVV